MAIDFGAFTGGARAAKKDYWDDVRNSQQSLIRDVAVQDGLQMARDKAYKESAASYLAPLLLEQQRAAASGTPVDETFRRQMQAIQNDPGLANMTPEQQYYVAQGLNASGVTMAQKLKEAGDETRALELNKFMGLNFGPENRANPEDAYTAYNLKGAGISVDPQTGDWVNKAGQRVNSYQGAQALYTGGQGGLTDLYGRDAAAQQQNEAGVTSGALTRVVDANGRTSYLPVGEAQLQERADAQIRDYWDKRVQADADNGSFDPNTKESLDSYLGRVNADGFSAVERMLAKKRAAVPPAGGMPAAQPPTAGVVPQTGGMPTAQPPAAVPPAADPLQQLRQEAAAARAAANSQASNYQRALQGRGTTTFGAGATPMSLPSLPNMPQTLEEQALEKERILHAAEQQAAGQQGLTDPRQLTGLNDHPAFASAMAADQLNSQLEPARIYLKNWATNLQGAPTQEDQDLVLRLIADNPELMNDPELMDLLDGVLAQ